MKISILTIIFAIAILCLQTGEAKTMKSPSGSTKQYFEYIRPALVRLRIDDRKSGGEGADVNGVLVSPDGLVLTCAHGFTRELVSQSAKGRTEKQVLLDRKSYDLTVVTFDGSKFVNPAVLFINPDKDLALLDLRVEKLPYLKLASQPPGLNDTVYFLGTRYEPAGFGEAALVKTETQARVLDFADAVVRSDKFIPAKGGAPQISNEKTVNAILIGLSSGPGYSGSPLLNAKGEVLSVAHGGSVQGDQTNQQYSGPVVGFPDVSEVQGQLALYLERINRVSNRLLGQVPQVQAPMAADSIAATAEDQRAKHSLEVIGAPEMAPFDHQGAKKQFLENYRTSLANYPYLKQAAYGTTENEIILELNEKVDSWPAQSRDAMISDIAKTIWQGYEHGIRTSLEAPEMKIKGMIIIRKTGQVDKKITCQE